MEPNMIFLSKTREVYANRTGRKIYELTELTEKVLLVTALILFDRHLFE